MAKQNYTPIETKFRIGSTAQTRVINVVNAGKKTFDKRLMNSTETKINNKLDEHWDDVDYEWLDAGEPDLQVETDNGTEYYEVETKLSWKKKDFQYNTIHIPARKYKYLPWQPLTFVVFNKSCDYAMVIDSDEICKSGWLTVKDTVHADNEVFFTVKYDENRHLHDVDDFGDLIE